MSKSKFQILRTQYPTFLYKSFSWKILGKDLHISFDFRISPNIQFHPKVVIQNVTAKDIQRVGENALKNLVFHLGLMEIPSYWKATCSPEIIIEAGYIDQKQIQWWKNLIINGMGEFFYQNKIDFQESHFLSIINAYYQSDSNVNKYTNLGRTLENRTLVPIGGGKDAIVTLEILKRAKQKIRAFILNPKKEQEEILRVAKEKNPVVVQRTIDPALLKLNQQGYLNGHTPFSAYLAFLTTLVATLFNYKYIAFSNERSSNEGNMQYLGRTINHQYSKTFDFEKKFREYSKKYLAKNVEYFSFLRPLYELQIAKIFAKFPKYFFTFLSCSEANKTASGAKKPTRGWCGHCAKCLFVFAALYPFFKEKELLKIFHKNLFEDKTLIPLMKELAGERRFKPFECVGTTKESRAAFFLSLKKQRGSIPVLLQYFKNHIRPKYKHINRESKTILRSWNKHNFLPAPFAKILKEFLVV